MKIFITALLILTGFSAAVLNAPGAQAQAQRAPYVACGEEDSNNCVWDARHMGNGLGKSYFASSNGHVTYLPHHIAHYLLHG